MQLPTSAAHLPASDKALRLLTWAAVSTCSSQLPGNSASSSSSPSNSSGETPTMRHEPRASTRSMTDSRRLKKASLCGLGGGFLAAAFAAAGLLAFLAAALAAAGLLAFLAAFATVGLALALCGLDVGFLAAAFAVDLLALVGCMAPPSMDCFAAGFLTLVAGCTAPAVRFLLAAGFSASAVALAAGFLGVGVGFLIFPAATARGKVVGASAFFFVIASNGRLL